MYPFERFTDSAKKTLTLAQAEAERAHQSYIGTEHLLLGLLAEGGRAASVLATFGVTEARARQAIASTLGGPERMTIHELIPTSRVKRVIEISFEEALKRASAVVGTEHLLLGLLSEGYGIAAQVLKDLGVALTDVRRQVDRLPAEGSALAPMRVIVLGGTVFIGRAIVEELAGRGYRILIVHRGEHEPEDLPSIEHLHVDRRELVTERRALQKFDAEAVVDARALTRQDAEAALAGVPFGARMLVLSSNDVYRAYGSLLANLETDPVPLDENSPLRVERYPYRGREPELHDYEKLDVEEAYQIRGATICRLPAVYGERDYQRREEFILRRVRAERALIPFGAGTLLHTRAYVRDVARGVRLAMESPRAAGEILNLGESRTPTIKFWARQILKAADSEAELVHIRDESLLPDDLKITRTPSQHLLVSSAKARALLDGWTETDPDEAVRRSVEWHLEHPPGGAGPDFLADARALSAAGG